MAKTVAKKVGAKPEQAPVVTRAEVVGDAAVEVLSKQGSRGLTHRAVDRAAGLSEGATSNLYRTRGALVAATLERQVERELQIIAAITRPGPGASVDEVASFIAVVVQAFTSSSSADLATARYELYLEGRRQDDFRPLLAEVRQEFMRLMAEVLADLGINSDARNAGAAVAMIEGLSLNQLFHPESALSGDDLTYAVAALLRSLAAA